LVLVQR
jgi:hypothetical protein